MKNTRHAKMAKEKPLPLQLPTPLDANYHGYYVSYCGHVYSFERNRWLKPSPALDTNGNLTGYMCQTININGKSKRLYIHRLVCEVYHGQGEIGSWVNHKDGDRSNNHAINLEWSTPSENVQHSYDELGRKSASKDNHYMFGKKHSVETKKLQSEAKKGIKHPKFTGFYFFLNTYTNTTYKAASARELKERAGLKVSSMTVYRRCTIGSHNYWFEPLK